MRLPRSLRRTRAAVSRLPAAVGSTANSQPSPYGSAVIMLGSSTAAVLISVTRPLTGRVQLGDGLGRLDLTAELAGDDGGADVGQIHEDELAE